MLKKLNHKIFNLIIMILISMVLLTIPNISNATEYFSMDSPHLIAVEDDESDNDSSDDNSENGSSESGDIILAPVETDYIPKEDNDKNLSEIDDDNALFSSVNNSSFTKAIKKNVAQWYYIFRYTAIAIMLVLLIILSIKMAITSVASQKALYKRMLVDWLVCFILLYFIHYFMIFVLYINESIINVIKKVSLTINTNGEYSLYETVRSRAYDWKFTVGFSGMILYMNLVWFTCKFVYIYAKRFITTIILTVIAPIIVLFYSLKKVLSGKANILTKWMEEYALNVILQSIHALLYAVFVGIALKLTESSLVGIIIALIILNFMSKADKIFREIFKFSDGGSIAKENSEAQMSELVDSVKNAAMLGITAKNTEIGKALKKPMDLAAGAAARTGIRIASTVGLGDAISAIDTKSDKKAENKNKQLDQNIEKAEKQMKFTADYLAKNGDRMSDKTKKAFEEKLKKATEEHRKNSKEKGNYNARRAMFKRFRQVLDPDTYMEFERDDDGNLIENTGIRKMIFGDYRRRTIRTKKIYNPQTGKKEVIQSLSSVFKDATKDVFGLTDEDKAVLKEVKEFAKSGLLGFGGLMIGMSAIADNPSIGFAMLASGISNTKKISSRKRKGFQVSRRARRAMRKVAKQERKEYTFKAFSTGALLNIDNIIRESASMDPHVGHFNHLISQMENGGYKLVTLPFTLTGTKGIGLNILDLVRKMADQTKKDIADYERDVSVKLMESITKEVIEQHKKVYEEVEKYIDETEIFELIEQREIRNGKIFTVTDANGVTKQFRFGDKYTFEESDETLAKNALINTAIKMNVYDIGKLDFKDTTTRKTLIAELKNAGLVDKDLNESKKNIDEIIFGKKDSAGNKISKGILDLSKKIVKEEPEAVSNEIYERFSFVDQYIPDSDDKILIKNVLIEKELVKKALENTAIKTDVYDVSKLDFTDEQTKKVLIAELKQEGAIDENLDESTVNIDEIIFGEQDSLGNIITESIYDFTEEVVKDTQERIKNALIDTAIKMGVYDVSKLDFRKQEVRKALIAELKNVGVIDEELEESTENINEVIFGKKDDAGNQVSEGVFQFSEDFVINEPDAVQDRIEQQFKFEDRHNPEAFDKIRTQDALINTAIKMNVYDVSKLNFRNQETRKALIAELKREGLIDKDIEESKDNINEIIFGRKDKNGRQVSKGILHFSKKFAKEDANAVRNRVYQQVTSDYMVRNGLFNLSNHDKANIRKIYTNRITMNNASSNFNTLLVSMTLANGSLNVRNISAEDILRLAAGDSYQGRIDLFRQAVEATNDYGNGNAEIFDKFNSVTQHKPIDMNSIDNFRTTIEERKDELNKTIHNVVISAFANNNIVDPALLIASPNDPRVLAFKEDAMNLLRFAGLQNSELELEQIIDSQIGSVTSENIEAAIIKDETQKYIDEKFNGDFREFKEALQSDKDIQEEFEEQVLERLKEANKDTSREQEIGDVLDLIRGGKVNDDTINNSKRQALNDSDIGEDDVIDVPYPEVKTTIKDDYILYNFFVPTDDKAKDCIIRLCKIDADGNKGHWIDIDHVDLREDEKIIVRLENKDGHGPALVLSYPKPISDVVSQIGKNKKEKTEDIDDVEFDVMSRIEEYDPTGTAEERFGNKTTELFSDPAIEQLFREREKTSVVNNISDVMDSILDYRGRLQPDDSKMKEILDDAVGVFDSMMHKNALDRATYENNVDTLVNSLLQQKYISDDADSVKIQKDRRKYKKYRQSVWDEKEVTSKNIANADFDRFIASLNS